LLYNMQLFVYFDSTRTTPTNYSDPRHIG